MASTKGRNVRQAQLLGPGYMTIAAVVDATGVTKAAVAKWLDAGRVRALKVGRRRYVDRASLARYLGEEAGGLLGITLSAGKPAARAPASRAVAGTGQSPGGGANAAPTPLKPPLGVG